jgi:uncharacterized cupredoxin-like copper-binding protein
MLIFVVSIAFLALFKLSNICGQGGDTRNFMINKSIKITDFKSNETCNSIKNIDTGDQQDMIII